MSDATPAVPEQPGSVPAVPEEETFLPEGLEDFNPSDQTIPILRVDHDKGKIIDGLTNVEYDSVDLIALGLIKQRVLWQAEMVEGDVPLCRSYDFKAGIPDMPRFPWEAAKFAPPAMGADQMTLPCDSCNLKEWGTHPSREIPWCSEQHTYAVLQDLGNGILAPALFTTQRSGIKPSNAYLTGFIRAQEPLFVCRTNISLDNRKRGNVDFGVPVFKRGEATDKTDWPMFADQYRMIRTFVQTPRRREDDADAAAAPDMSSVAEQPPTAPAAPPASQPSAAPGGDLPF